MYLNIGEDTIIKKDSIIGIFSIKSENNSQLINNLIIENKDKYKIYNKEYKTIILTERFKKIDIYFSKISFTTIKKRYKI